MQDASKYPSITKDEEQGPKVEFTDHILALWKRIGYSPDCTDLPEVASIEPDDHNGVQSTGVKQQDGGSFTPHKGPVPDIAKYTGVSVKQFPKYVDHGRIVEFLVTSGLPEIKTDCITIKNNGNVIIKGLENEDCMAMIEAIHGKRHFDKKLYCNGFSTLTPEKPEHSQPRPGLHEGNDRGGAAGPGIGQHEAIGTAGGAGSNPLPPNLGQLKGGAVGNVGQAGGNPLLPGHGQLEKGDGGDAGRDPLPSWLLKLCLF